MAKCEICKNKVETTFLDKIIGTYVKDNKGKKHIVCFSCQKKHMTKEDIISKF